MANNRDLSQFANTVGYNSGNIGIGTATPGAILEVFDATSNTIVNVKSGDSGAVLNLIDDSARSSIEQNGTTLKISSDTGAEDASSDIRLQVDGSTKMLIDSSGRILQGLTSAKTGFFNDNNAAPVHQIQGSTYYTTAFSIFRDGSGASGPNFILAKGREAIVQDNDILGTISFQGHDGTTELIEGASIVTEVDGTPGANDVPSALVFKTNSGTSSTSERLRITSDGKMGINDTSPASLFTVNNGTTDSQCVNIKNDNVGLLIGTYGTGHGSYPREATINGTRTDSGSAPFLRVAGQGGIKFCVDLNTERLRITSDGKVGVGVAAPAYLAHIHNSGTGSGDHSYLHFTTGDTGATGSDGLTIGVGANQTAYINYRESNPLVISTSGTERCRITSDGKVGIGTDNPQYSLDLGESSSTIRLVSENNGTAIRIGAGGGGNDVSLIRVDGNSINNGHHGESDNSAYGFSLKYMGARSGNDNSLAIFADNQTGTQFEAVTILQNGYFGINKTSPSTRLVVKQNNGVGYNGNAQSVAYGAAAFINESGHTGNGVYTGYQFNLTGDSQNRICSIGAITEASNSRASSLVFHTDDGGNRSEKLRITSDGHLVYDTNKGGIYNFDKACSANASTNIFRIQNEHGAHCFTIYMTGSNSGNSVSKIYHVACQYGGSPTINSAADTGAYGSNNFSLTGSVSGSTHTFAISVTGAAATIACTVVLGSMNTSGTVTVL